MEFDTHLDLALGDADANHVALDAGSIYSAVSASPGLDLKSGGVPITAWVQYDAPRRRLRAWLSHSASRRHLNPALSITVDLSELLNDTMFVGFSASNSNKGSALHIINSWSFRTYWPRHTSSGPLAASPPPPSTPLPSLPAHHHSIVAWLVGTLLFLMILAVSFFLWVCPHPKKTLRPRDVQLADRSEKHTILPKDVARSA